MLTIIPYYAGNADAMKLQARLWTDLGVESPFALENVPMHIVKGEAYHDDPDQAIRHLNWFRRHRWPRYQGLGVPVLDYEPATEGGGRSSWRWVEKARPTPDVPASWLCLLWEAVFSNDRLEPTIYNVRNCDRGEYSDTTNRLLTVLGDFRHVTRPAAANETITPAHLRRHADVTDIWCIDAHQLDADNMESFEASRKPVAIWLRDSEWGDVEKAVEVAGAKRKEKA